jgi:hypothetical protein
VDSAADRLLAKLRQFIADQLDAEERQLLATLLAPGVAAAHADHDVVAFGMVNWTAPSLPRALADSLQAGGVRVEGLER